MYLYSLIWYPSFCMLTGIIFNNNTLEVYTNELVYLNVFHRTLIVNSVLVQMYSNIFNNSLNKIPLNHNALMEKAMHCLAFTT